MVSSVAWPTWALVLDAAEAPGDELVAAVVHAATSRAETGITTEHRRRMRSV